MEHEPAREREPRRTRSNTLTLKEAVDLVWDVTDYRIAALPDGDQDAGRTVQNGFVKDFKKYAKRVKGCKLTIPAVRALVDGRDADFGPGFLERVASWIAHSKSLEGAIERLSQITERMIKGLLPEEQGIAEQFQSAFIRRFVAWVKNKRITVFYEGLPWLFASGGRSHDWRRSFLGEVAKKVSRSKAQNAKEILLRKPPQELQVYWEAFVADEEKHGRPRPRRMAPSNSANLYAKKAQHQQSSKASPLSLKEAVAQMWRITDELICELVPGYLDVAKAVQLNFIARFADRAEREGIQVTNAIVERVAKGEEPGWRQGFLEEVCADVLPASPPCRREQGGRKVLHLGLAEALGFIDWFIYVLAKARVEQAPHEPWDDPDGETESLPARKGRVHLSQRHFDRRDFQTPTAACEGPWPSPEERPLVQQAILKALETVLETTERFRSKLAVILILSGARPSHLHRRRCLRAYLPPAFSPGNAGGRRVRRIRRDLEATCEPLAAAVLGKAYLADLVTGRVRQDALRSALALATPTGFFGHAGVAALLDLVRAVLRAGPPDERLMVRDLKWRNAVLGHILARAEEDPQDALRLLDACRRLAFRDDEAALQVHADLALVRSWADPYPVGSLELLPPHPATGAPRSIRVRFGCRPRPETLVIEIVWRIDELELLAIE